MLGGRNEAQFHRRHLTFVWVSWPRPRSQLPMASLHHLRAVGQGLVTCADARCAAHAASRSPRPMPATPCSPRGPVSSLWLCASRPLCALAFSITSKPTCLGHHGLSSVWVWLHLEPLPGQNVDCHCLQGWHLLVAYEQLAPPGAAPCSPLPQGTNCPRLQPFAESMAISPSCHTCIRDFYIPI